MKRIINNQYFKLVSDTQYVGLGGTIISDIYVYKLLCWHKSRLLTMTMSLQLGINESSHLLQILNVHKLRIEKDLKVSCNSVARQVVQVANVWSEFDSE